MTVKASIDSLPTETKTRIAELCQLQDEIFLDTFRRLDDFAREMTFTAYDSSDEAGYDSDIETNVFQRGPFTDGRYDLTSYPKSLLSLLRVSKEWHDIAVKIVFRVRQPSLYLLQQSELLSR